MIFSEEEHALHCKITAIKTKLLGGKVYRSTITINIKEKSPINTL